MRFGVQVLLPGLFDLPSHELDARLLREDLPALNFLLSRARTRPNRDYSIDALLSSALYGEALDRQAGLPFAAAFVDDRAHAERTMLLEALHLQADMQGAIAVPIPKTDENLQDIDIIFNDLGEYFKVDCLIEALPGGRYLLRLQAFDPPRHYPHPLSVVGKSVGPFIEQSRQVLPWYRLVNELQMFMHQHPVNARRLRQGRLAINSLWAWGAGMAAQPVRRPAWFGGDDLLDRYADHLGLTVGSRSDLARGDVPGQALIVDLRLLELLKSGGAARLDDLLLDLERNLFEPLLRRPREVTLRAAAAFDFVLGRHARLGFWRRRRNLLDWC